MKEKEIKNKTLEVSDEIVANFTASKSLKKQIIEGGFNWDEREELFLGKYTQNREEGNSKEESVSLYSTGELQSLVLDSACRIMAQMPTGSFQGLDDDSIASVVSANLIFHEHIFKKANTGGDFFTKMRQVNFYSKIYGTFPVFIDYIENERYTGPDMVLIHPRRFYPQPGKVSIADMDWCFVDTPVTKEWLEDKEKNAGDVWNSEVIKEIKNKESELSLDASTVVERDNSEEKKGKIILRNYFTSKGDWLIYEPISGKILVKEDKYWDCIPMTEKVTIPLIDRYWGYSDYERGESNQKALDHLTGQYFQAIERSIEPTTIIDPEQMVMSSVKMENKFWFTKGNTSSLPRTLEVSPQGISVFPQAYNMMKANLMSMSASTDTSITKATDAGFGRTPQALKMQEQREGARDSWDRHMQERFFENVANLMLKVAIKRGMGEVKIKGIEKALEKIARAYPGKEIPTYTNGVVNLGDIKDTNIYYEVDPGSTMKKEGNSEKILGMLQELINVPGVVESLQEEGKKINWGNLLQKVAIEAGIQDWEDIVTDQTNPESVPGIGGGEANSAMENQPTEAVPEDLRNLPPEMLMNNNLSQQQ